MRMRRAHHHTVECHKYILYLYLYLYLEGLGVPSGAFD